MRSIAIAVVFIMAAATVADAKGRRRKRRRAKAPAVNEQALATLKGPFEFGMSPKKVIGILRSQITEKYAEKISATTDVYTQDKLRRQREKEIAKIRKSYVKFDGKKTGWEGAIIQSQFTHKTGESMMMFWETDPESGQDQRRFFFFHEGNLYKMFIALNSDNLKDEQRNFDFLKSIMERRFGKGTVATFKGRGGKEAKAIAWKSKKYSAWAIDNMQVFGSFCMVIASTPAVARVEEARAALPKVDKRVRLIQGVVERDSESGPTLDEGNASVVDDLVK